MSKTMKQSRKKVMSTDNTPAGKQQVPTDPVDYAADYEAMQEAERTHSITFTFTDEEWDLLREDIRRFTFLHGKQAPTFDEWREDRKCGILRYAARECAGAYDRMLLAAVAARKIGFAFEDRQIWQ